MGTDKKRGSRAKKAAKKQRKKAGKKAAKKVGKKTGRRRAPARRPKPGGRPGPPSKLTTKLIATIKEGLEEGFSLGPIVEAAGIKRDTAYAWKARGLQDLEDGRTGTDCARFAAMWLEARHESFRVNMDKLREAAEKRGHWQAFAWLLKMQAPEHFGEAALEGQADQAAAYTDEDLEHCTPKERLKIDEAAEFIFATIENARTRAARRR